MREYAPSRAAHRNTTSIVWRASAAAVIATVLGLSSANHAAPATVTLGIGGRANANVSLASSGSFIVAVWSASASGGDTDIVAATSRDAGRRFSSPVRVNSTPGDARVNGEQPPRLALKSRNGQVPEIAVVWTTKGTAGTKLLSGSSTDGGKTFSTSLLVPGSDAPGNRGWEAVGLGPGGRFFSVWLDHRKMAPAQQTAMAGQHHHEAGAATSAVSAPSDGVAMAQLSQLYVAPLDSSIPPQSITGGVCYCCKTAIASSGANTLYLAWRHVYAGNMRDMAFTMSRDGGRTFAGPIRVSEDKWQLEGCPDDGPSMAVDSRGTAHIVWPAVVTERSGPVKALFHAMTADGRTFTPRERIPTQGQANHPQLTIDSAGTLAVVWDESGSGTRILAAATGRSDASGRIRFSRSASAPQVGSYPVVVSPAAGAWLSAWTSGPPDASQVVVGSIQ